MDSQVIELGGSFEDAALQTSIQQDLQNVFQCILQIAGLIER